MAGFIFGGDTGVESAAELARKREIVNALMDPGMGMPQTFGEGLTVFGRALAGRIKDKKLGVKEDAERGRVSSAFDAITGQLMPQPGGAMPAPRPTAPVDPNSPSAIGADAMSALGKPMQAPPGGWLKYANQGATRNKPLDDSLIEALSFLPEMGVTMEVFSGGQDGKGEGDRRTGSTRHDHGRAADAFFYTDGRKLSPDNPADIPILQEIVRQAKARGVTGIGAGDGYMQPGSMHVGFGPEAVWGAGGNSDNAAPWLREAFIGAPTSQMPQSANPAIVSQLSELASNPYATDAQKAIISQLMGQQMDAMKPQAAPDPMDAINLEKAQLELAQLKNPQADPMADIELEQARLNLEQDRAGGGADIPKTLTERKALAAEAGLIAGTPEYQSYIATGQLATPGGGTEYGLQMVLGRDAKGDPVVMQLGKDGTAVQTKMPEGVTPDIGLLEAEKAAGTAEGKALGEDKALFDSLSSKMPGLEVVVSELEGLADKATYTQAGKVKNYIGAQFGFEPKEAAIARTDYIAKVDNQVLPMLRDTFGAAFTVKEGETLRATLGDPDKTPAEKKAVLRAFIEQAKRNLEGLAARTGQEPSGASGNVMRFDAEGNAIP